MMRLSSPSRRRLRFSQKRAGGCPDDGWVKPDVRDQIIDFKYWSGRAEMPVSRRLTDMLLDAGAVATSPSRVYRVLKEGGRLSNGTREPSSKSRGLAQGPHEDRHIDISYPNVCGTFYYLCAILDGYSRYIVHWAIRARRPKPTWRRFCNVPWRASRGQRPR